MRIFNCIIITILLFCTFVKGQTNFSGDIDFYYLSSIKDNHLINLPYRMFDITIQHQRDDFEIISNIAMEYTPQNHTHYLSSSNPQDFLFDLREFYLTWYADFGEICSA